MAKVKKQCGGIEDYQWLVALVIEAVVKVITLFIEKNKESKRPKDSVSLRENK